MKTKTRAAATCDTGKVKWGNPDPGSGRGSIPICAILEIELGIQIIFMGFGLDNANLHSPNEKYDIENYYKGIGTISYFHKYFPET